MYEVCKYVPMYSYVSCPLEYRIRGAYEYMYVQTEVQTALIRFRHYFKLMTAQLTFVRNRLL